MKCIIKGCPSGGRTSPEKVRQFPFPKDNLILRNRWIRAIQKGLGGGIKSVLPKAATICALHFHEVSVLRQT